MWRKPSCQKRVVELETGPNIDLAVQGRCAVEGISFEIPFGRVKIAAVNGLYREVSVDGKTFKMSKGGPSSQIWMFFGKRANSL